MRVKNPAYFKQLEGFIDSHIDNRGISPSTREIAAGTGLSLATVSRYLSYMREKGMIDYSPDALHRNANAGAAWFGTSAYSRRRLLDNH